MNILNRLISGSIFMLLPLMAQAQTALKNWTIEDHSGKAEILAAGDTLEITAPQGLTLWYNRQLTGDYEISYRVKMPMQGGRYDRLSDLNCFWAANDPEHPGNFFARSGWRNGIFQRYKTLSLFYVGYGGNHNSTTRFRRYFAKTADTGDDVARPVIKEYTDKAHLLLPDTWYDIQIRVEKGITTYRINGEELFRLPIKEHEGDGHFGLRLLENHTLFTDFRVKDLKSAVAHVAGRRLLEQTVSYEELGAAIRHRQSWVDYPAYADRESWKNNIDPEMRKIIIGNGERALKHVWKPDLASDYLAFKRTGEIRTGRANHKALQALTIAELAEGEGRFMDAIIDGVWFLCETSWIHSAHLSFQQDRSGLPDRNEPTIELVVGDIGAQMAWTYYFLKEEFDKVSPLINRRIVEEVNRNLIDPYFARDDYWWMGFGGKQVNNWNPWINYNVLQALMLIEKDPERVRQGVWKLMRSTDYFFSMYHEDGACDEGPTYWSGASGYALKFLDLLAKVTGNKVDIFGSPLLRNMAQYIYRVHIGGNYFVNFADSAPQVSPSPGILYQYGKLIGDPAMMRFASFMARQNNSFKNGTNGYFASALDELFMYKEIIDCPPAEPLTGSYWFKDTQICTARDEAGKSTGFFFAAKGGHNQESHNHNDAGSCILYYDALPVLIDAGVGTYTRQTFGPERYTIWTMQSDYHNLPLINGTAQKHGREFAAHNQQYNATARTVSYQVDIAPAYPQEANVKSWIRNYTLRRKKEFIITDKWELSACNKPSELHLMTCCEVEIDGNKNITLAGEAGKFGLEYDKALLSPEIDIIELTDPKLIHSWKQGKLTRIRFTILSRQTTGESKLVIKRR